MKSILAAASLCLSVLLVAPVQAQSFGVGGSNDRGGDWEAYGGLRAGLSESVDFEGGSNIDIDDDLGFTFGVGYNMNDHWQFGGEINWNSPDYDGNVVSADTPGTSQRLSGELELFSLAGSATYHLFEGPFTPYVSAMLGYTWIDTNIADGPPQLGCWWDPWWGQVCNYYVDTKDEEEFVYGLAAGVRRDFNGWFARLGYEQRWLDISNSANGSPSFGSIRLDIGSRF